MALPTLPSGYSPIGIFFGQDSVYAVQVKMRGRTPVLTAAAKVAVPSQADLFAPGKRLLRDTLRSLQTSSSFKGRRVHICLPYSGVMRRYIQVHKGRASLADVARLDLETVFPDTPLDQVIFAPVNVGERKISGAKIDEYVLLAAVPDYLAAIGAAVNQLNWSVTGISFAPEAAWMASQAVLGDEEGPPDGKSLTALLTPVGNAVDLSIWDGDRLAFVKLIGRETGAPQALDRMSEDVGEALWFYLSVHRESQLSKVVVTGSLAEYDQFKATLEASLDVPVVSVHHGQIVEREGPVDTEGPGPWTEAIGLCFMGFLAQKGRRSEFDFTPKGLADKEKRDVSLIVGLVLAMIALGGNFGYYMHLNSQINAHQRSTETYVNDAEGFIREINNHNAAVAASQKNVIEPALTRRDWISQTPAILVLQFLQRSGLLRYPPNQTKEFLFNLHELNVERLRGEKDKDRQGHFSVDLALKVNSIEGQSLEGERILAQLKAILEASSPTGQIVESKDRRRTAKLHIDAETLKNLKKESIVKLKFEFRPATRPGSIGGPQ